MSSKTNKKDPVQRTGSFEWQGQKGLNPQPSVLETDALPIELYPFQLSFNLAKFFQKVKSFLWPPAAFPFFFWT